MDDLILNFKEVGIELNEKQINQFEKYMDYLLLENEKYNLTSIVERDEIILKHFVDCATISSQIPNNSSLIDIGSGAGFPGIVLKILNPTLNITLVDSLDKRVKFLNNLIEILELKNIKAIHERAEVLGQDKLYREKFDIATSRAVAKLSILDELLLPFVKVGGKCLILKGPNATEEIKEAESGIKKLGGNISNIDSFNLLSTDNLRTNIQIDKIKKTDLKFPRQFSKIKKTPLK